MIRVAFMAHDGAGDMGGVATWMADLVPWLRAAGVDARVIGYRRPGATPLFDHFGRSGVPLDIRSHFDPFPDRVAWLAEVVRTRAIDVLVPNYFLSGFVAAHRMGRERSRVVAILHSDDSLYRRVQAGVARREWLFPADALVAVSRELARLAASAAARVPLRRIPYGVPEPARVAAPPDQELRVLYSGRLEQEQKRVLDTIDVACAAVEADPRIRVDFLGDGTTRAECEHRIGARGTEGAVRLLGRLPTEEVRRRLPDYHALLLLSDYEGLPLALLEAAAAGVVPVCTRMRSGIDEIVSDGESGFIVDERPQAVLRLRRLLNEPEVWERCSDGVRAASRDYRLERSGAAWLELLEATARSPRVSAGVRPPWRRGIPRHMKEFGFDFPRPAE